jgi:hypothetical protein
MESMKKKMEKVKNDAEASITHFEEIKVANELDSEMFEDKLKAI